MKKSDTKNNSMGKGVALGAGIAAIAAAAAGNYFLYGKKAVKRRRQVKAWSLKAKGEILEQLENLSEVNEEIYHRIVKEVSNKYQSLKNLDSKDVLEFIGELKEHWKNIAKEIKSSTGAARKKKRSAKKSRKKISL